ncbi:unnamed protein product, partial [Staurois parvus]
GTREHGEITNVSKPFIVQLNWAGFGSKWGRWGRDSYPGTNQKTYWGAILRSDARIIDLLRYQNYVEKGLIYYDDYSRTGQGSGMIMYDGSMYYNCYNTRDICKYNTKTYTVESRSTLSDAAFNNRFSYAGADWQDIDFAGDENGLWVIYATEHSNGNMVLSKLNATTLAVQRTWHTNQYKPAVTNAFMVVGILYATRAVNTQTEEIFYMYNTKTGEEGS